MDTFYIRRAIKEDMKNVFLLSNDELVRKNSINFEKISWEEHKKWFNKVLQDDNYAFYVILNKKNRDFIGQVRFRIEGQKATISISIKSKYRGQGLGKRILKETCNKFFQENLKVALIEAIIKPSNLPSIKAFEDVGFLYEKEIKINNQKFLLFYLKREK